jgi:hypothetical protein
MRPHRNVFLLLLAVAILLVGGVQAGPVRCSDGCADEEGTSCVDCPLCSPARAPVLLGQAEGSLAVEAVAACEAPVVSRCSRTEDRAVFHVPRLPA